MAYLTPEIGIVLFVFRNDASLRLVISVKSAPFLRSNFQNQREMRTTLGTDSELGSSDEPSVHWYVGIFDGLDGANSNVFSKIEIHSADRGLCIGDLLCNLGWHGEGLLDGGMQPPLVAMPVKYGASQHVTSREIAPKRADFDPGPARSGP